MVGCGAVVEQRYVPVLKQLGWAPAVLVDTSAERLHVRQCRSAPLRWRSRKRLQLLVCSTRQSWLHEHVLQPAALCRSTAASGFVEKPMAATRAACTAMNSAAAETGRQACRRVFPPTGNGRTMVERGAAG